MPVKMARNWLMMSYGAQVDVLHDMGLPGFLLPVRIVDTALNPHTIASPLNISY